nr:hypothetical protein [Clostridioides sp.]
MKGFSKLFVSISLTFSLVLMMTVAGYANNNLDEEVLESGQVKVTVTNDQTGETHVIDQEDLEINTKVKPFRSNDNSINVGYDVFIPLEEIKSEISPFTVEGGSKTSGGITAKLYVDYDVSSDNQKVRLNKVYGSWTPTSSLYYTTNRSVTAHTGTSAYGKKITKKPPSNFSYTTGWGYNVRIWGSSAPRAWSTATAHVNGMSGTHTIKVEFTYS